MPRTTPPRLGLFTLAICVAVLVVMALPGVASAHNTLLSSDPPDGAVLTEPPSRISWTFDKAVPLETMTVTLIDATGARQELTGSTHGSAGSMEVVTPLPALSPGPVSLRWRLVGPDGHPITGRVDLTLAPASTTTIAAASPAATEPAATTIVAAAVPTATEPVAPATTAAAPSIVESGDGSWTTPAPVRWILRYASYLAILTIVGLLLVSVFVWDGARTVPVLRRILRDALFATAILGFLQLLVVASDINGRPPWSALTSIDAAGTTDAGMALMIRIVLALSMWLVLFRCRIVYSDVYWTAVAVPGLGLLATWAFAGHSRSMRWPALGVVTDVAHHAAAAAWLAGLAVVGWMVIPRSPPEMLVSVVRRFSRLAAVSVAVLVVTGLVQGVRLVGDPTDLVDAAHGRYLLLKIVVLAAMLGIANANRNRVNTRLSDVARLNLHVGALRRAVVAEFAIGLVIVGITAAMVVSPPSTSQPDAGRVDTPSSVLHYVVVNLEGTP